MKTALFILLASLAASTLVSCNHHTEDPNSDPPNMAISMDGTADHITVANTPDLYLSGGSFTLETWVKATPNDYFQGLINHVDASPNGDYWMGIDRTNVFRFTTRSGNVNDISGHTVVEPGKLYHVAAVADAAAGMIYLYVNGVLENSAPYLGQGYNPVTPLYLGANKTENVPKTENLSGLMDETRIWNVARTPTQIIDNMSKRLRGNEPGLVAYYHYDDGTGTSLVDATGKGHTGSFVGAPQWVSSPVTLR